MDWVLNHHEKRKKYTYYRLMKAVPNIKKPDPDNRGKRKVKGKMAQYLGSENSQAYKNMKEAIPQGSRA